MIRILTLAGLLVVSASPAHATTEWGCWQPVGVAGNDVLNVRRARSARSAIVGAIPPFGGPIIAGGRGRAGAEANCGPASRPRASRWCKVSVYGSGGDFTGYVKRRFLRHSECP